MINKFLQYRAGFAWIFSALFVTIGLIVPFMMVKLRVPCGDEFYQALNVRGYENAPIAMLTFYIGNVWGRIFGENLLNLRILMVLCMEFSIGLGCAYFYRKTGALLITGFLFMTMSLLSTHCTLFIYGWDIGAYPFIMLTLIASLYYLERGSLLCIALTGVSTALMVLSRVPTIVALPIILLMIIYHVRTHKDSYGNLLVEILKESCVGLAAFVLTAVISIYIMGGFDMYITSWKPDNIISGHSLSSIDRIVERFIELVSPAFKLYGVGLLILVSAYAGSTFTSPPPHVVSRKRLIIMVIMALVVALAYRFRSMISSPSADFGFGQSILLVLILYIPIYNLFHREKLYCPTVFFLTLVFFSLLAAVGSDSVVERPLTLPIIPIAAIYLYMYKKTLLKWFVIMIFILTISINFATYRGLRSWSIYEIAQDKISGVRLEQNRYEQLYHMLMFMKQHPDEEIEFLGWKEFEQYYILTNSSPQLLNQYHYYDSDTLMVNSTVNKLSHASIIFLTKGEGQSEDYYKNTMNALKKEGYVKKKFRENYYLYTKISK